MIQVRQWNVAIAIQDIVGAKGDDVSAWKHMMRAAFHHTAHVKIVSVQERCNRDAKQLLASKLLLDGLGKEIVGNLLA
jgi:hypothetical protein